MYKTRPKVLIVDNFDSFTWNIFHLVTSCDSRACVVRNDSIDCFEVKKGGYSHVILGPGPRRPEDSGASPEILKSFAGRIPVLGICLGMQIMAHISGGNVKKSSPLHGKTEKIYHEGETVFKKLPSPFSAARYNSLSVIEPGEHFKVTARNENGVIMGLSHDKLPCVNGVQFHPESFMSEYGRQIMLNFLEQSPEKPL
ncbi:MAG: aminodeoxychorismate/anthranilate synthase component II [bacterium]